MQFADERSFSAQLRIKVGFFTLPLKVTSNITDIVEPERLTTSLEAKGLGGSIWLDQEVTFVLNPVGENGTEIKSQVISERMSPLLRIFLLWKVRSFSIECLVGIERLLKKWT